MDTAITFPVFYQGIYQRVQGAYGQHIEGALNKVQALAVHDDFRPFLAYQTWKNPQPSFILFPLMFLATAEASGGIKPRHLDYLPTIMLLAELTAVADDTVDRTPMRSGRATFARKFGDASALPFATALTTMTLVQAKGFDDRLFDAMRKYYFEFFTLELWEQEHIFPDRALFSTWLAHRYAQGTIATECVLNSALIINERPLWPHSAIAALDRIGQDVDDIVNLVEYRELDGENDDLQTGIVTRPLVLAIKERPALADQVESLWQRSRPLFEAKPSITDLQERRETLGIELRPLYSRIREEIIGRGVPLAVALAQADIHESVRETPESLRPLMSELSSAFMDRLHRCRHIDLSTASSRAQA